MSNIYEILASRASNVIEVLGSTFSTRDFILAFMNAYEEDYVKLLVEALPSNNEEKPKIIQNLHQQIGRYLDNNADKLKIKEEKGKKDPSLSPFGKHSSTQCWRKL